MHLTPEQIDRQPFRMTRRGYDIVQVRDFLREIATEMRERQVVRNRLAANSNQNSTGSNVDEAAAMAEAQTIVRNAEGTAASIVAEAEERAHATESANQVNDRADEIIANAEAEAGALLDQAEARARERSGVVIAEAQARLDQLLAEEKTLRQRVEAYATPAAVPVGSSASSGAIDPHADSRDRMEIAGPDTSLADFMKATLRHEVRTD